MIRDTIFLKDKAYRKHIQREKEGPSGTPHVISIEDELLLPILWPLRYEKKQLNTGP